MIISASRRTDIPAFYSRWLVNRLREGFCRVPNPFNPKQVAEISLLPETVDVIVFWTRNPRPLFPYLDEINRRGYRYYFQFTLLDYPRVIDRHTPSALCSLKTFCELADKAGSARVIWRYDPILLSEITSHAFHVATFTRLAEALRGYTKRVVISFLDLYPKVYRRLVALVDQGVHIQMDMDDRSASNSTYWAAQSDLALHLAEIAKQNEMEIFSCAEERDLQPYGIKPGKCIDDELIRRVFGIEVSHEKDLGQRKACGCATSRDIGMYDTCLFGCQYCYATRSFERSLINYRFHDPNSSTLI